MNLGHFRRRLRACAGTVYHMIDMAGITVHFQDQMIKVAYYFCLGFAGMFYSGSELVK